MESKVNSSAVISYADFLLICHVDDPRDFGGFKVEAQGVYVILPSDDVFLTSAERAAICWHPTGNYDHPALALPCTVAQLRTFVQEAGLTGCIDEDELPVVTEQSPINNEDHTPSGGQNTGKKCPVWLSMTIDYMAQVMTTSRLSTAKDLRLELKRKINNQDSPFQLGTVNQASELYIPSLCKYVTLGMLQNNIQLIKDRKQPL